MRRSLPSRWEKGVPGAEGGGCRDREVAGEKKGFNREIGVKMPGSWLPRRCCHLPSWKTMVNSTGVGGAGGPSFSSSCPVLPNSSDGLREVGRMLIAEICSRAHCVPGLLQTLESAGVGGVGWSKQSKDTACKRMWDRCEQNRQTMCPGDKCSGRNGRQGRG